MYIACGQVRAYEQMEKLVKGIGELLKKFPWLKKKLSDTQWYI